MPRGHTGQDVENFAIDKLRPGYMRPLPVRDNPVAEVVGVGIRSYASVNVTYTYTTSPPTGCSALGWVATSSPRMIVFQARLEF